MIEASEKARRIARIASDAKAEDVVIIDVHGVSSIADCFVILTGTSQNHLRALHKRIEDDLEQIGIKAARVDGQQSPTWLVIDYGDVIVHAILHEARIYYDLERLWGDAPQVEWA